MNRRSGRICARLSGLLLIALLSGCGAGLRTPWHPQSVATPGHWTVPLPAAGSALTTAQPWPHGFNDPALARFIEQALTHNHDLARAGLRLYQARLQTELTRRSQQPQVAASLDIAGAGGAGREAWRDRGIPTASVTYQADLWGKLASQRDEAHWRASASAEDLAQTRLELIAEASGLYWRTGEINARLALSRQQLADAERTEALVAARYTAGAVSRIELAQARQQRLGQLGQLRALEQQRRELLNAQSVLLGLPPGSIAVEPEALPAAPLPPVRADLPAEVLARRPDLRAAEDRLRVTLAKADTARLALYPTLTLTDSLGGSSDALVQFLHNPITSAVAQLTLPFVQWRQLGVSRDIAYNDYQQSVLDFQQTLYKALAAVDNALNRRLELQLQREQLNASLAQARLAARLNGIRYREGEIALQIWLEAQAQERQAERDLAQNRLETYLNLADLWRLTGGDEPLDNSTSARAVEQS